MTNPAWIGPKGRIDENIFCREFLEEYPLRYNGVSFFNRQGMVQEDLLIQQTILQKISPWVSSRLAMNAENLLRILRIHAYTTAVRPRMQEILFSNGTYDIVTGTFREEVHFSRHRLRASYNPNAAAPSWWLGFLYELLEAPDVKTLQEYLGYCLIPCTRAQKMLMIIGRGGEGKSQIGAVMGAIFGDSLCFSSIQKVEMNRFARADLEGKLVMVDDDMDLSALTKTNYIKSIITAQTRLDVERKGTQSYQAELYPRFLCFGNGALSALHDRSDGFFRRQIILTARDRDPQRKDDPFLAEKMIREYEGIVLWMLEGLERLLDNDFNFSISDRTLHNLQSQIRQSNNILEFMESTGYIYFDPKAAASTNDLYNAYRDWCVVNADPAVGLRTFSNFLSQNQDRYQLLYDRHLVLGCRKEARGYRGIGVLD